MVATGYTVDLDRPLVFQVGHLGEAYDAWVHQPIVGKRSPRLFHNDLMEFLTLTPWWVIPIVWLPVAYYFVRQSVIMGLFSLQLYTTIAAGIFLWTFIEYCLHRFLFHLRTKTYWGNTIHYLLHGCHHKHPMDGMRLVFPPAAAVLLAVPIWYMIKLLAPSLYAPALFGGGLLGYVMYDCTHYYLHHGKPLAGVPHDLRRFHMHHHFKIQDKGFGITTKFWDRVFGTLPPESEKKSIYVTN